MGKGINSFTDKENSERWQNIVNQTDPSYMIVQHPTFIDWQGKNRTCHECVSKSNRDNTAFPHSSEAYALAMRSKLYLENDIVTLQSIKGKKSRNEICHRCRTPHCCNIKHLMVDSRDNNEVHKHYHYVIENRRTLLKGSIRKWAETFDKSVVYLWDDDKYLF